MKLSETMLQDIKQQLIAENAPPLPDCIVNANRALNVIDIIMSQRIALLDDNKEPTKIMMNCGDWDALMSDRSTGILSMAAQFSKDGVSIYGLKVILHKGETVVL